MRDEYDFSKGRRGPIIPRDPDKVGVTIFLDTDIIDYFKKQVHKAGGGDFRMINHAHNNLASIMEMEKDHDNALFHYKQAVQSPA